MNTQVDNISQQCPLAFLCRQYAHESTVKIAKDVRE
jgi:hypothetical protein